MSAIGRRLAAAFCKVAQWPGDDAEPRPRVRYLSLRRLSLAATVVLAMFVAATARGADRVAFGLDWKAEAEYGGYYQALATGLYAKRGLDVTIEEGGPQVNHMMLLMAGRLDFNLGGGRAIEFAEQNLPFLAVAAIFQKDLAVLIAHPGQGNDSFAALKGKPIMIGADARVGWWRYLAAKFGYDDSQIRPYRSTWVRFLPTSRLSKKATPAASLF